jgi:transposase
MANQKFTAEFREEAVRQVLDRGYSVKEVSENLGVSTHSLYKWLKGVRPRPEQRRDEELLESKREILKLRAALRRTQEERDILKKAAARSMGHRNTMTTHTLRKDMVTDAKTNETTSVRSGNRGALASVAGGGLPERHFTIVGPKAGLYLPSPHRGRRLSASAPSTQSLTSVFCGTRRDLEGALCGVLASKRG